MGRKRLIKKYQNAGVLSRTIPGLLSNPTSYNDSITWTNWTSQIPQSTTVTQQSDKRQPTISMGSKDYQLGKGRVMNPEGTYTLFHTFGYGTDRKTKMSGVDCSKKIINTLTSYMDKGCNTLQDLIMMYHLGMSGTWDQVKSEIRRRGGLRDQGTKRWIPAEDWIKMQETYQKHCSDYMHLPLDTKVSKTRNFLYPLVTFISRQEQGVNSEAATNIALQQLRIL